MTRGRKPGFKMPEEHRDKIKNSNILNALLEHVEGKRNMSSTQVQAGLGLLRKVLPDLSNTTVDGKIEGHLTCSVNYRRERRPDDQDD